MSSSAPMARIVPSRIAIAGAVGRAGSSVIRRPCVKMKSACNESGDAVIGCADRSATLATIPTFREQGLDQFDMTLWLAFYAPAGTPPTIVERLSRELQRVIALPESERDCYSRAWNPSVVRPPNWRRSCSET